MTDSLLHASLHRHRRMMVVATAVVVGACLLLGAPTMTFQLWLLAVTVGCIGLPHGALDFRFGRRALSPIMGSFWWLGFGLTYIAAASAVLLMWWWSPLAALVGFMVLSAAHFGSDDPAFVGALPRWARSVERFSLGSLPIVVPMLV